MTIETWVALKNSFPNASDIRADEFHRTSFKMFRGSIKCLKYKCAEESLCCMLFWTLTGGHSNK